MGRPNIPADLERAVLIEAGHRCAIHTCRSEAGIDVHHIVPWAKCKKHEFDNLIALCPNCHRRAHKGEIDAISLRNYKKLCQGKMHAAEVSALNEVLKQIGSAALGKKVGTYIRLNIRDRLEILDCHNISSVTDAGELDFGFNFAMPMPYLNYVVRASGNGSVQFEVLKQTITSSFLRFSKPCPGTVYVEFI